MATVAGAPRAEPGNRRLPRVPEIGLFATAALLVATICAFWSLAFTLQPVWLGRSSGIDFGIYMQALDRWLDTGQWYQARQLTGPYAIALGDVLYPPVLIVLLLPFKVLGGLAWALTPLAIISLSVWRQRPRLWATVLILLCVAIPYTPAKFVFGNPVIWAAAALALAIGPGRLSHWPAAFVLLKPSVAVFAFFGVRDRRWWLAAVGLGAISLLFLEATLQYPQVLLDARTNPVDGRGGILYSLQEFPLLAIPLIAWLGARERAPLRLPQVRVPRFR